MYSKQEVALLTEQFWTSFGGYMAPVLSAEGERINWVNYKTGVKDIKFMMIANREFAKISITVSHKDTALQQVYFNKFILVKKILQEFINEEWKWAPVTTDQLGKTISEIYTTIWHVNILQIQDWPAIISFLKSRIIALDEFWCEYRHVCEDAGFNEQHTRQ